MRRSHGGRVGECCRNPKVSLFRGCVPVVLCTPCELARALEHIKAETGRPHVNVKTVAKCNIANWTSLTASHGEVRWMVASSYLRRRLSRFRHGRWRIQIPSTPDLSQLHGQLTFQLRRRATAAFRGFGSRQGYGVGKDPTSLIPDSNVSPLGVFVRAASRHQQPTTLLVLLLSHGLNMLSFLGENCSAIPLNGMYNVNTKTEE